MKDRSGGAGEPGPRFDASGISATIERALSAAGLDTRSGPMKGVTDTIEQALSAAGLMQRRDTADARGATIDGIARRIDTPTEAEVGIGVPSIEIDDGVWPRVDVRVASTGEFLERSFTGAAGSRKYKIYIPAGYSGALSAPVPMIVMLHGCTQSPDDFAAGTRMNSLADEHGFVVVYPAQSANANLQRCWNWFRTEDQVRESGEPAIVVGITREVVSTYRIDERRIFVAGMSAGAAMATILGATYPDLYSGVGVHSGLAYGAAHDMPSAFNAMQVGAAPKRATSNVSVPTIVFHGDKDHTVNARNATTIVEQSTASHDRAALRADTTIGSAAGGGTYTRTRYTDASNRAVVEQWALHGAGHAWSGGSSAGSFTDTRGPDASREMVRFFYSLPRAGTA